MPLSRRVLRRTCNLFLGFAILACLSPVLPAEAQSPRSMPLSEEARLDFIRIGTGPAERTLYRLGSALTGSLSAPPGIKPPCRKDTPCGVPGLLLVAQSRAGAFESLEDMARGRLESALVSAEVLQELNASGSATYAFDMSEVLLLGRLSTVHLHVLVLEESAVKSLSHLPGRVVAVGLSGSSSLLHLRRALASEGIGTEQVVAVELSLPQAFDALEEGEVDAVVFSAHAPLKLLQNFAQRRAVRLLDIKTQGGDARKFARASVLPAEIYQGRSSVWYTLSFDILWVVSRNLSEEVVYRLTRALWHGSTQDMMRILVPEVKIDRPHRYRSDLLPLHPGAARWYKEQGLLDL